MWPYRSNREDLVKTVLHLSLSFSHTHTFLYYMVVKHALKERTGSSPQHNVRMFPKPQVTYYMQAHQLPPFTICPK